MPDSNITKRALATALKSLMNAKPFAKISVGDICEFCDMNRKSFYYHFKDKYDLVNWIYYTECLIPLKEKGYDTSWDLMDDLCEYFYENHEFYRKTLNFEGQNSFSEYFRDIIVLILQDEIKTIFGNNNENAFYVDFYADAFLAAIKRWLLQKDCIPAKKFVAQLKNCLIKVSQDIVLNYADKTDSNM